MRSNRDMSPGGDPRYDPKQLSTRWVSSAVASASYEGSELSAK
jgi:hypothetical protein